MKFYFAPGACSLAAHIALLEAGLPFEGVRVDLKTKRTQYGEDYAAINPKGYVPALQDDDGEVLTENVAILTWIAEHTGAGEADDKARFRRLEMLAYLSSEVHKSFKPFFTPDADDAAKAAAGEAIGKRLAYVSDRLQGDYLFGDQPGVADDYLFVMLTWAAKNSLHLSARLTGFMDRMGSRTAVRRAMEAESQLTIPIAAE